MIIWVLWRFLIVTIGLGYFRVKKVQVPANAFPYEQG